MTSTSTSDPIVMANSFRESISNWLEQMGKDLDPGRFRFCKTRSLVPSSGNSGQMATCFAAKSAWNANLWGVWPSEVREGCVQFIKSFQSPDGNFVDRWLMRNISWGNRLSLAKRGRFREMLGDMQGLRTRAIRAETRQSAATLIMLGDRPAYPLPMTWQSESSVRAFIRSLDWSRPWSAGSHASHLVMFIALNSRLHEACSSHSRLLAAAFEETDKFLDDRTGAWGIGEISTLQRINGAMKMLTAYEWAGLQIPRPDRLVDYALSKASGKDGCGVLDRLYVLQRAGAEVQGYRDNDLERLGLDALEEIAEHLREDGGFSFYPNRSQRLYYGTLVSLGENQSDLHGAVMFTWACAVALDLLGIREECGWQISSS